MAKKTPVRKQDQFLLRLPDGMRERIKAKADRADMSMNEAIVWALERAFPPPATFEEKVAELVELVAVMKGDDTYHLVDKLVEEIHETLDKVSSYRIKARPNFRNMVNDRYERLQEEEHERLRDIYENALAGVDWEASDDENEDDPFPDPVDDEKS